MPDSAACACVAYSGATTGIVPTPVNAAAAIATPATTLRDFKFLVLLVCITYSLIRLFYIKVRHKTSSLTMLS